MNVRNLIHRTGSIGAVILPAAVAAVLICAAGGCGVGGIQGYSNEWLHPQDVGSVYVEMFDTRSFRRGYEYSLTSAICKLVESRTPYKIVSNRDTADTILSGQLTLAQGVLSNDRYEGRALEREVVVKVTFTWKNLKTGEILVNQEQVAASGDYADLLCQDFDYAAGVAVNRVAERVVERMEKSW
jgi:hypothetical protein